MEANLAQNERFFVDQQSGRNDVKKIDNDGKHFHSHETVRHGLCVGVCFVIWGRSRRVGRVDPAFWHPRRISWVSGNLRDVLGLVFNTNWGVS